MSENDIDSTKPDIAAEADPEAELYLQTLVPDDDEEDDE